jgi:hypothetical protein
MTFSVEEDAGGSLSRILLALIALASVVAAAPGGGAHRFFANKHSVLDSATRVGVCVPPTRERALQIAAGLAFLVSEPRT